MYIQYKKAFTLIELLTVIAIITIFIGLLSPALNKARKQAKKQKAKAMIGSIEVALNMYYADWGFYPNEVTNSNNFANTLGTQQTSGTLAYGPYIQFKTSEINVNAALDPWGSAYRYDKSSPPHNSATFDLWSIGPNGTDDSGGGDDITNW